QPYRPMLEALEARDMMSANPMVPVVPAAGGDAPLARLRILASDLQPAAMPATGGNLSGQDPTSAGPVSTLSATPQSFQGSSDASAAVPIQYKEGGVIKDGVLVGDDKSDVIRLYDSNGGGIVRQFDMSQFTGTKFQPNGTGVYVDSKGKSWATSSDIEAAARVGNTIYWMTSSGTVIE